MTEELFSKPHKPTKVYTKEDPFFAQISKRYILNKEGSGKCTVHLSLDIKGSDLAFEVGDSIGVYPQNATELVQNTLDALSFSGEERIEDPRKKEQLSLREYLTFKANITKVTKKWLIFLKDHLTSEQQKRDLSALLDPQNKEQLKSYLEQRELWDCFNEYEFTGISAQAFAEQLGSLLPRFYSIASSPKNNPNQIDLLIAYFHYCTNENTRYGVASHYLCEEAPLQSSCIPIYIQPSKDFKLTENKDQPIIMIGPGTGLAPFRAFMQERALQSASKNWLFFGDWNEAYDFYYEEEFKEWSHKGLLKLSTAFSRDQKQKIYVQDRMLEEAALFWKWLEEGAIVYVCGDAQHMAKDVDFTLQQIIQEQGKLSLEETKNYIKNLKAEKRYLRDVY